MVFSIHTYGAADGAELRYGVLTAPQQASLSSPRQGLVFVPGLGGSVKNSLVFFNALLRHFSPIIVPDLRGFGLNDYHPLPHPRQFVADLNTLLEQLPHTVGLKPPWLLGGISLGGCVISHWLGQSFTQSEFSPLGAWLLAPAVKEHPKAFDAQYVAQTLWAVAVRPKALMALPYGLEALTQNPAVLNSPAHQEFMANFRLPARFLWQLRGFNRSSVQHYANMALPVHMSVPLADRVICPQAMQQAFTQLKPHVKHGLVAYPGLFHDVPLEQAMGSVITAVAQWADELL
ncbi:MAG: alpha/beta fold hydrolase [Vampirovibrionales bacterium]